jgi:hypothetical protein
LILGFALVTFGCEAGKNISDFSVTAEGTSEGILLHFDNISQDAFWLCVAFYDVTTDEIDNQFSYSNIGFDKNELSELRKSNNLQNFLCPFVINGHEYEIYIHYNDNEYPIIVNAVAGGGISLINEPRLYFNDENNGLILSVKPAFSDGVHYLQDHFSFSYDCLGLKLDWKNGYPFIGCVQSDTNDLVCDVSDIYNEDRINHYLELTENEKFFLFGVVYCYVEYNNFPWLVKAAKTEKVIVSL